MSSLLYNSISSGLTEDEIIETDRQVAKNREAIWLFVRKLPSNSKRKVKRLRLYLVVMFAISQPLVPCATAVVMPLPPVGIHRLSPMKQTRILSNKKGYPQIAIIPEPKIDKIRLSNEQIKQFNNLTLQLNSGSISMEEAILRLRGGNDMLEFIGICAFFLFLNYWDWYCGVQGLQVNPLPHQDPFGWWNNRYNPKGFDPYSSQPRSRFERETLDTMKQMCAASADENGFVMSYDEAYNLIKETYSGSMEVTEDLRITDWQAASHLYHGTGVNVNPEDFGLTQTKGGGHNKLCTEGKQITFYGACKKLSKLVERYLFRSFNYSARQFTIL